MTSNFFSTQHLRSLKSLKPAAKIHVIGVCGVAMAQLAVVLAKRGFIVSGSDKEFYEPMGSLLRNSKIGLREGYSAEHITKDLDLVVIGNAVSADHPEVEETKKLSLPYAIFPQLLHEVCISGKHSIVVSGTHGKSTTTAIGAYLLENVQAKPSYFVGGVMQEFSESLRVTNGAYSIVEGDEYDSAFFAKIPKFSFYAPDTLIITSIEFDHADIYKDLSAITYEFEKLLRSMPQRAHVIACGDDPVIMNIVTGASAKHLTITTYGQSADCAVRVSSAKAQGFSQEVTITGLIPDPFNFTLGIPGLYNAKNAAAILTALSAQKFDLGRTIEALKKFRGVKRRQEIRLEKPVTLIEDFAHHPTAVRETLSGIRAAFPAQRIWAVFEPRSNTSRKKVFQPDYEQAFGAANTVVLCNVVARSNDRSDDLIDIRELSENISKQGVPALALSTPLEIEAYLLSNVGKGDVIVLMSNGAFGGIAQRLEKRLGELD